MSAPLDDEVPEQPIISPVEIPEQKGFFKIPARFGHVPVAEIPLGYDPERRFEHHYPRIELPFQVVDVVKTQAERLGKVNELFPQGRNRLFFGDNLHVMRMLPSESIDLIYIDPPFFSGRNYNIIFGDKNEIRSFSDIWEGGMPGYLIWLNTRLYEMKRLLKSTGSIYVHLDWHASHYVKCELDKIFGYDNFITEIVWQRVSIHGDARRFANIHDIIFLYSNSKQPKHNPQYSEHTSKYVDSHYTGEDPDGRRFRLGDATAAGQGTARLFNGQLLSPPTGRHWQWTQETIDEYLKNGRIVFTKNGQPSYKRYLDESKGIPVGSIWIDIPPVNSQAIEKIGYPTQKPEQLLERIINATTDRNDVVADFFCGGGATCAVAHRLGRRWIGSDISRVAVALTADRIARLLAPSLQDIKRTKKKVKEETLSTPLGLIIEDPTLSSVEASKKKAVESSILRDTGYSVEHWGIYEIDRLTKLSDDEFRAFVLACYGARKWTGSDSNIHGVKGRELLWIGGVKETDAINANDVKGFASAVMKSRRQEERQAVMIGWTILPSARAYADKLVAMGKQKPIQFIKLQLWSLDGEELKKHVTKKHDKYKDFFRFILPPEIPRIGVTRLSTMKYRFDVSEARSVMGGKIINVQWDFDFRGGIFSATQGFQLCRKEKKGKGERGFEGELTVEYTFEDLEPGTPVSIACRVQDDLGGEGIKIQVLKVH